MQPTSPAPDEIQPTIEVLHNPGFKEKLPFKKILLIALAIILVLASIAFTLYLTSKKPAQLPISTPKPSPSPKSLVSKYTGIGKNYNSEGFNKCVFLKDKDKLITQAQPQANGTISVAMSGNIMDIQSISDKLNIVLISYDGSQGYQFTLPKDEQIVWQTPQATQADPAAILKTFLSVNVFGVCDPKSTINPLTINQINIKEDLTKRKR